MIMNSVGQKKPVYFINSKRFVDEYQPRVYVYNIEDAINASGRINTDIMGKFITAAVEKYIMFPDTFQKWYPDMY